MAAVHVGLALAMGIPGAARFLIAAIIATAAVLAASPASAAPYPVSYDFSQGVLAQAAHPDSPPAGAERLVLPAEPGAPAAGRVVMPLLGAPAYTGPPR